MRMVLILIIVVKKKMSFEGWRKVVLEEETQNTAVHVLLIVGQSSA